MTRAAIMPEVGDPFVALLWFDFFEKYWQNEVDRLYFVLSSPEEPEVANFILDTVKANPKVSTVYTDHNVEHGDAINSALGKVTEDTVMLIENDGIIFKSGKVNECFDLIEKNGFDIVGSDRGSSSMNLIKRGQQVFGLTDERRLDKFPHFWPNFFFVRTKALLDTDRNFNAKSWKPGEIIKELDNWTAEPDPGADVVVGDTFVWASIQLMAKNPKVKYMDQYHAYVNDAEFKALHQHLWDGNAAWLHYGSISTGVMGMLTDDIGRPLNNRKDSKYPSRFQNGTLDYMFNDDNRLEYERRIMWWLMCYEIMESRVRKALPDYADAYKKAVYRTIKFSGLNEKRLSDRMDLYRPLLKI
jgi:hypothetical protein